MSKGIYMYSRITERLDERFADLHANDKELDRWVSVPILSTFLGTAFLVHETNNPSLPGLFQLIETLFSPLKEAETKKDI